MERKKYIDASRTISCILVMIQHCRIFTFTILGFHMPFFFFLSGFLEKEAHKDETFKHYVKKKFSRLMIPYFLFELVALAMTKIVMLLSEYFDMGLKYEIKWGGVIRDILLCQHSADYIGVNYRYWFMPCLFVSLMLFWSIRKILSKIDLGNQKIVLIVLGVCLFITWTVYSRYVGVRLPWELHTAVLGVVYIIIGFLAHDIVEAICKGNMAVRLVICVALFIICALSVRMNPVNFSMFRHDTGYYLGSPLCLLGSSISGIAATFLAGSILQDAIPEQIIHFFNKHSVDVYPEQLQVSFVITCAKKVMSIPIEQQGIFKWINFGVMLMGTLVYTTCLNFIKNVFHKCRTNHKIKY